MFRKLCCLVVILVLSSSGVALALEFAPIGARAQGMGGAYVATAKDASAVYWNPAGLAAFRGWEVQSFVSVHAQDHMGVLDTFDEVESIMDGREIAEVVADGDTASVNRLDSLLRRLDNGGKGVDLNTGAGLIVKGHLGGHAFAVSGLPLFPAGASLSIDLQNTEAVPSGSPNSIVDNQSRILLNGLEARQYAVSYSHALFEDKVFAGINLKVIDGITYHLDLDVLQPDIDVNWDNLRKDSEHSQQFSVDIGLMAIPFDWLRVGLVGRDLTRPGFTSSRGEDISLEPQFRGGIALLPLRTLTVALDFDLSENESFTRGYRERNIALGVEKTFLKEMLSLRVGGYRNVAEDDSNYVATAGLGLQLFFLSLDLGTGYDFDEREVLGSAALTVLF